MSSSRGSVAHTATYHGADGCSNPNYHKGIYYRKAVLFARIIYLKHFRKDSEGVWRTTFFLGTGSTNNKCIHAHTNRYVQLHAHILHIHAYTYNTYQYRHAYTYNTYQYGPYTCIYTLIHAYTCGPSHGIKCIKRYVHVYTCMCMNVYVLQWYTRIHTYTYKYIRIHTHTYIYRCI